MCMHLTLQGFYTDLNNYRHSQNNKQQHLSYPASGPPFFSNYLTSFPLSRSIILSFFVLWWAPGESKTVIMLTCPCDYFLFRGGSHPAPEGIFSKQKHSLGVYVSKDKFPMLCPVNNVFYLSRIKYIHLETKQEVQCKMSKRMLEWLWTNVPWIPNIVFVSTQSFLRTTIN